MAKKKETNWEEELRKSYQNWEYLSHFGGHDPGWPDGVNMNLVRNHIIYEKRMLIESKPDRLPDIYFRETPPEVDSNFMARKKEIRENALNTLYMLETHPDYKYLFTKLNDVTDIQKALLSPIRTARILKEAIDAGDYIAMRRYEKTERYMELLERNAEAVRNLVLPERQLTFEDLLAG